ncbi:MAG: MCE family protein [Deltaproteobacteria bacterium]|nr:MCE family protein [Deltaproteobacteria bacterium]
MISRKYETVVGLFVVASLVALLIMVLIVAQEEGLWVDYADYQAEFRNVAGLKKGSEVRLAGVKVGTVTSIDIGPRGEIIVTFQVMGKYKDQIRQDTKAHIGYIGLLGDRSLEVTAGSPKEPVIPPEGKVASIEPLDFTDILAKAQPYLEDLQKVLSGLASITKTLSDPEGDMKQVVAQLREIVEKANRGEGTLGMFINDQALYRQTTQAMANANKILQNLESSRGLMGALVNDPSLKKDAKKTIEDLRAVVANLITVTKPLKETAEKLPNLAKKVGSFLENLDKAGEGLPDLVISGQGVLHDADQVAAAAKRSWLLRRYLKKPQERTIRMEREIR